VGWVLAPHAVREKLVLAQESSTLCPPAFSQAVVSAYLAKHDWRGQVKQFRELYRERRDAMLTALSEHMPPGASWTRPDGGFYVWLTLPEGLDAKAMLPRAVTARVAYVPGTAFYADGFGSRCMRLSYCHPPADRISEGCGGWRRDGRRARAAADLRRDRGTDRLRPLRLPQPGRVMSDRLLVLAGRALPRARRVASVGPAGGRGAAAGGARRRRV
jgi:DNA-binding transcriptional MocR family regulator